MLCHSTSCQKKCVLCQMRKPLYLNFVAAATLFKISFKPQSMNICTEPQFHPVMKYWRLDLVLDSVFVDKTSEVT